MLFINKARMQIEANLSEDQHGFTAGRSTVTAMMAVKDWVGKCAR